MQVDPDQKNPLEKLAITVGIYIATFLGGAAVAFAYSYGPLHSGKNWMINYLEERVESKDTRLAEVEGELARVKTDSEGKPDSETFKLLQDELATTDKTIQNLERKLARAERRIKDLERSRSNWKKKHAASQARLEQNADERAAVGVAVVDPEASAGSGASASPSEPQPEGAPASPSPSVSDDPAGASNP